jgi:hypothetical protein
MICWFKVFRDRVLKNLYRHDEESSDEEVEKKGPKYLSAEQKTAVKRKALVDQECTKTEDKG